MKDGLKCALIKYGVLSVVITGGVGIQAGKAGKQLIVM